MTHLPEKKTIDLDAVDLEQLDQTFANEVGTDFGADWDYLVAIYNNEEAYAQKIIDDVLITVCGWSLPSRYFPQPRSKGANVND